MKTILLALISIISISAHAATKLAPEAFIGNYKLVESRFGSCADEAAAFITGAADLRIDSFLFSGLNLGAQETDDELMNIKSNGYTTADGAFDHMVMLTKANNNLDIIDSEAHLNGDTLHLISHNSLRAPKEENIDFTTECVYQKVAN